MCSPNSNKKKDTLDKNEINQIKKLNMFNQTKIKK